MILLIQQKPNNEKYQIKAILANSTKCLKLVLKITIDNIIQSACHLKNEFI